MKVKKRFFIKRRIIIITVLVLILISLLTVVSMATVITREPTADQVATNMVREIISTLRLLALFGGIVLIIVGICNYFSWKSKLKQSENKEEKNEIEINIIKEFTNKSKSRMKSFIVLGIVLIIASFMLRIMSSFAKPVIYIYPEEDNTEVTVTLTKPNIITCSYPDYNDGWHVVADRDGTIKQYGEDREYYSLYWEGDIIGKPMKDGFVVKGEDTAKFLEEKLAILGLTDKEAEEFIIYWLPKMENNNYNLIRFSTLEEINKDTELKIDPEPETLIRIQMQYKPLTSFKEIPEQELTPVERKGYTVVEWGGLKVN